VPLALDIDLEKAYVVVAAYREVDVIAETVGSLVERFPNVVVVDDGSADATSERACQAGAFVLRHPFNLGQGAALQTGDRACSGAGCRLRSDF
jgi:polyprenyl-phospho-N-acetylgalactosaminyl synthase